MLIRPLIATDLNTVTQIEAIAQGGAWSEEVFTHCFASGYPGWVLEKDHQVIGFIIVSSQMEECHILNICIHTDFQRQGLGEKLMNFLLEEARREGIGTVFLEVRRSNRKAIALYHKLDFVQIGERTDYYPAGKNGIREDALVFALDLSVI